MSTHNIRKISPEIPLNAKWSLGGVTVAGGNGEGDGLNQLNYPRGIDLDDDLTVYIADWGNNRIVACKESTKTPVVVAGGNGARSRNIQLDRPMDVIMDVDKESLIISDWDNTRVIRWSLRKQKNVEVLLKNICCWGLAMDKDGFLYVADRDKNEVRKFRSGEKRGEVVAGGNGEGDGLNQLYCPHYIFIDDKSSLYVSEEGNRRVSKWEKGAKTAIIVAGGNDEANELHQLSSPEGIFVDSLGRLYIADSNNSKVVRWTNGQAEIILDGDQVVNPNGLAFDKNGNLYIGDCYYNHVKKFARI